MLRKKKFWNLELVNESRARWGQWLRDFLSSGQGLKLLMTPNPEQLVLARKKSDFLACLKQADLLLPDGIGLVRAGGFCERLTGVETVKLLLTLNLKVLLIGGRYAAASREGKLRVGESDIFYIEGYKNVCLPTQSEIKAVQVLIASLRPEVVLVALGAPMQEKWLVENRALMAKVGVRLGMVVGGSFDFLLGKVPRAPKKWRDGGWEWLWRLRQEPRRWRRQLALPKFVLLQWGGKWKSKN